MLLSALFQEEDPLVVEMRQKLVERDSNFFSLDDLPLAPMVQPAADSDESDRLRMHPNFVLTLWYMVRQMKDAQSKWRPYLDMLPKEIPTPLFWTKEELQVVIGTNLYEGVEQLRRLLTRVHETIWNVDNSVALEDILYAYTVFSSRAFAVSTDKSKGQVFTHTMTYNKPSELATVEAALVPYADIFNHSPSARVQYVTNNDSKTFHLHLDTLAQNGQEILNNYGQKSNEGFILGYGFVVLDDMPLSADVPQPSHAIHKNPNNSYWVQINIDERDPQRKQKIDIIKRRGLAFRHYIPHSGKIPDDLLQVIRISLLDNIDQYFVDVPLMEELSKTPANGASSSASPLLLSFDQEILMFDTLKSLLRSRLSKMEGSTAEEDRAALTSARLQSVALSWPHQIGWQYRVEQKETLVAAIKQVARLKQQFLSSSRQPAISPSDYVTTTNDDLDILNDEWKARIASWRVEPAASTDALNQDDLQTALVIPMEWIICRETVSKSMLGNLLRAGNVLDDLHEELLIAIFILFQLHIPGQPFHDYFQAIAKTYHGRPKYMNAMSFVDHDQLLQSTPAGTLVSQQLDAYQQDYRQSFCKLVQPLNTNFQDQNMFAWKHFAWAFSVILTEGLPLPSVDDSDPQLAILPTFGTRKISCQEVCELVRGPDNQRILVKSSRVDAHWYSGSAFPRNDELISNAGFFVKGNNMDVISIPLYASEDDPLLDSKLPILAQLNLDAEHFVDSLHAPMRLLAAFKIILMDKDELEAYDKETTSYESLRVGPVTSKRAIATLNEVLQDKNDSLHTIRTQIQESLATETDEWLKKRFNFVLAYVSSLQSVLAANSICIQKME